MTGEQSLLTLKLVAAAIGVLAVTALLVYRLRQNRAIGSELKSRRQHLKDEEERRCPHYSNAEIKQARKGYVRPDCAQVDPANEIEFRRFASVREPIFSTVDRFIENSARRHLLVLADSGMGKTTFCLNYFEHVKQKKKYVDIALISLARTDASKSIQNISSKRTTTLILDAFDEDPLALSKGHERLIELMDMSADFPLVIITCRSHFFENDAAIPTHTGISRIIPRSAGRTSSYEFSRLYLLPFTENQIESFLKSSFHWLHLYSFGFRRKARELVKAIPDLSARPMLLALVPELIRSGREPTEIFELYDYMVDQWLIREEKWVKKPVLENASIELAFYLSKRKQEVGQDRISPDLLRSLHLTSDDLEWGHLTTRSLLNRDSEGNLKFAHRSIMEFLAVKGAISGDSRAATLRWTDFMREMLLSYAYLHPTDQSARNLLDELINARSVTHFPYADQVSQPLTRSKGEFDAIANPGRNVLISRHTFPRSWLKSSFKIERDKSFIYVNDLDHGLYWRVIDLQIIDDINLFKVSVFEMTDEKNIDGFSLPSFPEIITLLRIQVSQQKFEFFNPSHFYWVGDKSDSGSRMLFSLRSTLDHPAATLIRSDVKIDGKSVRLNLYALDPYKFHSGYSKPRALEVVVRRREIELLDKYFHVMLPANDPWSNHTGVN
jgi:hypothetical protein